MHKLSKYDIYSSDQAEADFIDDGIVEFNKIHAPFTQTEDFIPLNYHVKDEQNNIIAGVNAVMYCWGMLYINVLIVDEKYRGQRIGLRLIQRVETEAKSMGASLSHLDTFDWQAKAFYLKAGYEIFGVLEDCPPGHKRYYMKKKL